MSFQQAAEYVRSLPKDGPVQLSNEDKLKVYALYKQATEGDVQGSQPWNLPGSFEARAKWDAWNAVKGMSKADAEAAYVKLITDNAIRTTGKDWK